jgi:cytochrome c
LIPIGQSLEQEFRMTFGRFALPLAALIALSAEAFSQETVGKSTGPDDAGQLAFNNACRTCHTLKDGDNRLGPSLHKVIGRKAGSLPSYGYSRAMKNAGMVWDKATLDRFIANPDQVVSGNNMKPFGGLNSAEERAQIVAFLEANSGS